jgi:hypothetical protein
VLLLSVQNVVGLLARKPGCSLVSIAIYVLSHNITTLSNYILRVYVCR